MRQGQGRVHGQRRKSVARRTWGRCAAAAALLGALLCTGCSWLMDRTDRQVADLIAARQREALHYGHPVGVTAPEEMPEPDASAYRYAPRPSTLDVPPGFAPASGPAAPPGAAPDANADAAPPGSTTRPAAAPPYTAPGTAPSGTTALPQSPPAATAPAPAPRGPGGSGPEDERSAPAESDEVASAVPPGPVSTQPALRSGPDPLGSAPDTTPDDAALTRARRMFTLVDALAYAQQHRREYMTAKEDLYLSALALTLERHLWTPIFSSNLRTVYGNFGEVRDFDQAMRFVADLGVSQRLPYGGAFTAEAIATLVRDVKQTITAEEGGLVRLAVDVPLLRGAGHVARETLIQLERELTYSVRTFERFRRRQLVLVAQGYFDLLRFKQRVTDSEDSLERARYDYERALAFQEQELTPEAPLDTMRAEQRLLSAQNFLAEARETFRARADAFKLTIGMPVEEPLAPEDLTDIESIERQIAAGVYPALRDPPAVGNEAYSVQVALDKRLDLLTFEDRIDDARRGVTNSRNALLPDFDFAGSVTFNSDPAQYNVSDIRFDRANWRAELLLELPLERTAERNELRRALIDVRQAQRDATDFAERIRTEVREALYQLRLQSIVLEIQRRNLYVAQRRAEYAAIQYEEGLISNRDKIEAETELLDALNALNAAKTARWTALLSFRLATETLRIEEDGTQTRDPDMDLAPAGPSDDVTTRPE